ncbi:MAG: hypothetical protein Q7T21_10360 [Gallionella sp.]|nr:hypothetical protein [Gallionella sp.]
MESIDFEGWKVKIDDLEALNRSHEVSRIGLVFEQHPGLICASAEGNLSAYYCILSEVRRRIISGAFNVTVELKTGVKKKILLSQTVATENDKDIMFLVQ